MSEVVRDLTERLIELGVIPDDDYNIEMTTLQKRIREDMVRVERAIIGAWRAEYDYVDVFTMARGVVCIPHDDPDREVQLLATRYEIDEETLREYTR